MASTSGTTTAKSERLARYLARCGVASRRKCEEYIKAGWIRVDGKVVSGPEMRIVPDQHRVEVRGREVIPPTSFRYIILNKPSGILCTCKAGREKGPTLLDLVKVPERIFPVGRLDKNSSGLILLTNDGDLTQRLAHPSFEKEKEYLIETGRPFQPGDLDKLRGGIVLDDGLSRFKVVKKVGERHLQVTLTEGRKRQIRRSLKAIGLPITSLVRTRFGPLLLFDLPEGHWRDLTRDEIRQLKAP